MERSAHSNFLKMSLKISYAPDAWKLLEGIFCVYKPAGITMNGLKKSILSCLVRDLNSLEGRPPENYVKIEDDPSSQTGLTVTNVPSFADNTLVVGPRYRTGDIHFSWTTNHGTYTSGLSVVGVNCDKYTFLLRKARYLKCYQACGRFGTATNTFHEDGKIVEKSTFGHIKQFALDRLLASIQAAHQQHMYHYMGVDIKSQTAYELASKGLIRPAENSPPILYGIKCIDFNLPEFTIEIQCINENEGYLMKLIHEIGLTLRSTAVCTKLRQVQFGPLSVENALLNKHWTLEHIINNIIECRKIIKPQRYMPSLANFIHEEKINEMQEDQQKNSK